jgi:hypothetical protein
MSREQLLRRIEHLERSVRWRTRLLAGVGTLVVLAASSPLRPSSLIIGQEGGPMVTIENGVLELTDQSGHRARLTAAEFELSAKDHTTRMTVDEVDVSSAKPDFWSAAGVTLSPTGLRVVSGSGDLGTHVGPFFVKVASNDAAIEMSVTPEGAQKPVGGASLEIEAGPKRKGGVIRLDAAPGKTPVLALTPSGGAQVVTLSTDGKLTRSPMR